MNELEKVRTLSVRVAFSQFSRERMAFGQPSNGMNRSFCDLVELDPTHWTILRDGKQAISDGLARRIEYRLKKPERWLDEPQEDDGASWLHRDEQDLARLALEKFRTLDEDGRVRLLKAIDDIE